MVWFLAVFCVGKEPWDGPVNLYDMLDIPDEMKERMKFTVPDYRMNLIDARHMSDEEIDRYEGDLKAFLLLLRDCYDRERMKSVVATHRETWYATSKIKNNKGYMEFIDSISDKAMAGGVHMDTAWEYIAAEGKAIGIAIGEANGKVIGEERVNRLGRILTEAGRTDDFIRSLSDRKFQKSLFAEFGLEMEK